MRLEQDNTLVQTAVLQACFYIAESASGGCSQWDLPEVVRVHSSVRGGVQSRTMQSEAMSCVVERWRRPQADISCRRTPSFNIHRRSSVRRTVSDELLPSTTVVVVVVMSALFHPPMTLSVFLAANMSHFWLSSAASRSHFSQTETASINAWTVVNLSNMFTIFLPFLQLRIRW